MVVTTANDHRTKTAVRVLEGAEWREEGSWEGLAVLTGVYDPCRGDDAGDSDREGDEEEEAMLQVFLSTGEVRGGNVPGREVAHSVG